MALVSENLSKLAFLKKCQLVSKRNYLFQPVFQFTTRTTHSKQTEDISGVNIGYNIEKKIPCENIMISFIGR